MCRTIEKLNFSDYDICLLIRGKAADSAEAEEVKNTILSQYHGKEVYVIDGMQDIYDYILILE